MRPNDESGSEQAVSPARIRICRGHYDQFLFRRKLKSKIAIIGAEADELISGHLDCAEVQDQSVRKAHIDNRLGHSFLFLRFDNVSFDHGLTL